MKQAKPGTFDADSTAEVVDPIPAPVGVDPAAASLIRIPPQMANTLVWVGLGILIGVGISYYASHKIKGNRT